MPKSKYQIRFLTIAEEDLNEIASYIALDNPKAANALVTKIEENLLLLSENSLLGRLPRDEEIRKLGFRYLVVRNFIIFYTVENKTFYIHRILHGARNYKTVL